jgi:hypothetical protein
LVTAKEENRGSYGERKITQMKELKLLFWGLDLDEGIRLVAEIPGYENGAFVFATRCNDKICVSIKERVFDKDLNDYVPGGREQWKYFEKADAAWLFFSKFLKQPLEAYYY